MSKFLASGGTLPQPASNLPVGKTLKVESKIWKKIKRKNGLSQKKFI